MKTNTGILYLGLHNQLVKKFGINKTISRKEFFCKLGRHYMIPKSIRSLVINEMVKKRLIERVDRDNIKILDGGVDFDKDSDQLFHIITAE